MLINFYLFIIFFVGFFNLCINRKGLLMFLLGLEFIVLLIYFQLIIYLNYFVIELYFRIFFLVFSVCEGVLGLSILIYIIRIHGTDRFQVLRIL